MKYYFLFLGHKNCISLIKKIEYKEGSKIYAISTRLFYMINWAIWCWIVCKYCMKWPQSKAYSSKYKLEHDMRDKELFFTIFNYSECFLNYFKVSREKYKQIYQNCKAKYENCITHMKERRSKVNNTICAKCKNYVFKISGKGIGLWYIFVAL